MASKTIKKAIEHYESLCYEDRRTLQDSFDSVCKVEYSREQKFYAWIRDNIL